MTCNAPVICKPNPPPQAYPRESGVFTSYSPVCNRLVGGEYTCCHCLAEQVMEWWGVNMSTYEKALRMRLLMCS